MKYTFDQINEKLSVKDKKTKIKFFYQLLNQNDPATLIYLLNLLKKEKIPNGRRLVIDAMGDSHNPVYIETLLDTFAYSRIDPREPPIALDALIKIGVFNPYFGNKTPGKEIREKLHLVYTFYGPRYIIELLQAKGSDFEQKVKHILSVTSHWRK